MRDHPLSHKRLNGDPMTTEEILEHIVGYDDTNVLETFDLRSRGVWECALQLSIIASKLPSPDPYAGSLSELNKRTERAIQIINTLPRRDFDRIQDTVIRAVHVLRNGTELD